MKVHGRGLKDSFLRSFFQRHALSGRDFSLVSTLGGDNRSVVKRVRKFHAAVCPRTLSVSFTQIDVFLSYLRLSRWVQALFCSLQGLLQPR